MPRMPLRSLIPLILLALCAAAGRASGQWPTPRLGGISPPGGQAGGTIEITLGGADLEGIEGLWFDDPGIRAFLKKDLTFAVAIAPTVAPGHHEMRAYGRLGVSNPRTFVVGARPEAAEVEPNNVPAQATPLPPGTVLNGAINPAADVDCFAFEGKQGERFFFELEGERIDSPLDGTLRLFDPNRVPIAESQDVYGIDPFLDVALPADGRYVLRVYDATYQGSPEHSYRLVRHAGPYLDAAFPPLAAPGAPATVQVIGRALGAGAEPAGAIGGRPVERKPLAIAMPATGAQDARLFPTYARVDSSAADRRGLDAIFPGAERPLFIAEATEPVVLEVEPNGPEMPQAVALPCDIGATFGDRNDWDVYRFQAKKGEVWWIEARSAELDSPADPTLFVQSVPAQGEPQDIANSDDERDRRSAGQMGFNTASADSALRWEVPADGTYQVAVADLYGAQRGDARFVYRLTIRREKPDFSLYLLGSNPAVPGAATLRPGGKARVTALVKRGGGFRGPVRVELRDLPPGVRCAPALVGTNQGTASLVLEADENAKPAFVPLRLVGTSRWTDRKELLEGAAPDSIPLIAREAIPGVPGRRSRDLFLQVLDEQAPMAASTPAAQFVVGQGKQLTFPLAVARRAGFADAVTVATVPTIPNLAPATVAIPKEAAAGELAFYLPRNAPAGVYSLDLQAQASVPFSKDPKAEKKPIAVVEPVASVSVIVREVPAIPQVDNKGGNIAAGKALEIEVAVARQKGNMGPVRLSLVAPPAAKLSAAAVTVPPDQNAAKMTIQSAPDSPPGAVAGAFVSASMEIQGQAIETDEPLALTIVK